MDAQRTLGRVARGDQPQAVVPLVLGEPLLLVARLDALPFREQPDLIQVHRLVGRRD